MSFQNLNLAGNLTFQGNAINEANVVSLRNTNLNQAPPPKDPSSTVVAPWPLIDKYPTIVGSSLSLSYLSACYRLALTGFRREYVDALSELIERDPHLYAVLMMRVLTATGARIVINPRNKSKRAKKIAEQCQVAIDNIQGFRQSLAAMVFSGIYYGIGACEINWVPISRKARLGSQIVWEPQSLGFIHSRRLNFPDPNSWDVRIWDQGAGFGNIKIIPTQQFYGLRLADYAGKFITFMPQLHADYPTREGVGRVVAFWSALKTMGARGAAQYIERYAKPWAVASYATTSTGTPRAAEAGAGTNNDINAANAALHAFGTGALAGAVIPDSIKVNLQQITGSRSNIGHKDWIDICNREMSKGVLGQTDTTDGGATGSRARASVMKTGSDQIARFDVMIISDALQIGLIDNYVLINDPENYNDRPVLSLAVDPEPDPYGVVKLASMAALSGLPVDADDIAKTIGIRLVKKGDKTARPMAPIKPMDAYVLYPDLFDQPEEEKTSPAGASAPSDNPAGDDGTGDEKDNEDDSSQQDDQQDNEGEDAD